MPWEQLFQAYDKTLNLIEKFIPVALIALAIVKTRAELARSRKAARDREYAKAFRDGAAPPELPDRRRQRRRVDDEICEAALATVPQDVIPVKSPRRRKTDETEH